MPTWRENVHPNPGSMPNNNFAYGAWGGLLLIAGPTTTVNVFDPATGEWDTLTALSTALIGHGKAATVGDWLYWLANTSAAPTNYRWWRYNPDTGVTEQLTSPPSTPDPGDRDAVALDGLIYLGLGTTNHVYDPGTDTWGAAPGTAPSQSDVQVAEGSSIAFTARNAQNTSPIRLYDGSDWTDIGAPTLPGGVSPTNFMDRRLAVSGDLLHVATYHGNENVASGRIIDLSNVGGGWSTWPLVDAIDPDQRVAGRYIGFEAVGGVSAGVGFYYFSTRSMWTWMDHPAPPPAAIAIARATAIGKPTMQMAGRGRSTARATASGVATVEQGPGSSILAYVDVDYDFRTTQDSFLTGFVDIVGGTGQVETVLAFVTIPEKHVASFAAFVDVVLPVTPDIQPIPLAPEGNLSIVQPDIP